jgi:hypothetical protein
MASGIFLRSQEMPDNMAARGNLYNFQPPQIVGVNGQGVAVTAGGSSLTWGWTYLSDAEATYLYTTVLQGEASVLGGSSGIKVYNHLKVLTTYNSGTIFRPSYDTFRNGHYMNVVLRLESLET